MVWNLVLLDVVAAVKANTALTDIIGLDGIYKNRSRATIKTPTVTYTVLSETVEENNAPVVVQLDIWASSLQQQVDIEAALYSLLHSDLPQTLVVGGHKMWTQYDGGYDFGEQEQGLYHRAVVYRFTPARYTS